MNNLYKFAVLMLSCVAGTAQAQKSWVVSEGSVETIQSGAEHFYVLQEGDNTKTDGTSDNHSQSLYLSSVAPTMSQNVTDACVFNFIEDGENSAGHQCYVLKNYDKNIYLGPNGTWVKTKAEAYHFTASKAKAVDEKGSENTSDSWEDYYNIVSNSRSIYAAEKGAWVLCNPEKKEYIGFVGNISFANYIDTNNWFIKEATGTDMTAQEKLLGLYDKYFGSTPVDDANYPIGTEPGCVSQEFFNKLTAVFQEAEALVTQGQSADTKACEEAIQKIVDIFKEYNTSGMVQVGPGYYLIENARGGHLLDNGKGYADKRLTEPVESWNINNAKYIWQIEESEDGKLLFKNFGTGRYLGKNNGYAMTEEAQSAFTTPHFKGTVFNLHDGSGLLNVMHNGYLTVWNDANDQGNQFTFKVMDQAAIDTLAPMLGQSQMNKKLSDLVNEASSDLMSVKYSNGFMASGAYNHPADTGLVRKFMETNATSTAEGSLEGAFDANFTTYYHTAWGNDAAAEGVTGNHWVQLDLGKKVSELVVKFTERVGNYNGSPVRFQLEGTANDDPNGDWGVILAESADSIRYTFASAFKDSATYIQKFTLSQPSQYVRFVVTKTKKDIMHSNGSGPIWHVSEFRLYDATEIKDNPKFAIMDKAAVEQLNTAIAAAEAQLKDKKATQETYDALEEALDNFWKNYPSTSDLEYTLEVAQDMTENAVEGDKLAQYQTGAIDALKAVVEKVSNLLKEKTLTLAEVAEQQKVLDDAIDAFNGKLNVPASDKIYRLVCVAPTDTEDEPHKQWNSCVASINADVNGNPVWRYNVEDDDVSSRLNTYWEVKKDAEGFTFRNIANGLYLGNPYEGLSEEEQKEVEGGLIHYSTEPKHFNLEAATQAEEAFLIRFTKNEFLNTDPVGQVVHYGDRNDVHAFFTFQEVSAEEFTTSYNIEAAPNKVQIITVPVELGGVYTTDGTAYKVIGKKDGKIHLDNYTDGETIGAGVPFIVVTGEDENFVDGVVNTDLEGLKNLTYNYEANVQNGLVGAPVTFKVKVPYGILVNGKVIPAEEGTRINAGTGYFNTSIPEVETEGAYTIDIEGDITGEGTAVENVEIVKNVPTDVYTLSGVKIRHNVKASDATKGLPKGIYIVGGKKVVVK